MMLAHVIQWGVMVVLFAATILQFAVYRAPDLPDDHSIRVSTRLMLVGMAIGLTYLFYLTSNGTLADKPLTLVLGLIGVSQGNAAMHRLFPGNEIWH